MEKHTLDKFRVIYIKSNFDFGLQVGFNSTNNTHTISQDGLKRNGRSVSEKEVEMAEIPFNPPSAN